MAIGNCIGRARRRTPVNAGVGPSWPRTAHAGAASAAARTPASVPAPGPLWATASATRPPTSSGHVEARHLAGDRSSGVGDHVRNRGMAHVGPERVTPPVSGNSADSTTDCDGEYVVCDRSPLSLPSRDARCPPPGGRARRHGHVAATRKPSPGDGSDHAPISHDGGRAIHDHAGGVSAARAMATRSEHYRNDGRAGSPPRASHPAPGDDRSPDPRAAGSDDRPR